MKKNQLIFFLQGRIALHILPLFLEFKIDDGFQNYLIFVLIKYLVFNVNQILIF